jgi:phenylacetic acid degradation operon negative regulatory protein
VSPSSPSATRVALALLGASRGRALSAPGLLVGGELLGVSPNAMRIALSRLAASGDVVVEGRGQYALAEARLRAIAHVRAFRTGFAARLRWKGGFIGVLTADLARRNAALVRRRERALALVGMRAYRHGLYVRPDNLDGGRSVVAAHLSRLGLDDDAVVVGISLEATQLREVEALYDVRADTARASALETKVRKLLVELTARTKRELAAKSFFLGDEVLRFLARDPLLPESMADPAPRRALADAMSVLDEQAYALWRQILDDAAISQGAKR